MNYTKNKKCSSWLGVHVAEQVLSKVFKNVVKQPYGFPGYDFKCNKGMKIDSKAACLNIHHGKRTQWKFDIKHNRIADYFLCIAFDNRESLTPLHLWLIPGNVLNNKQCASITKSSIDKWNEYIIDIDKIFQCCNTMKHKNEEIEMTRITDENKMQTTINTIQGTASYSHTEIEDKNEKWDDHWQTSNGEYVIHENINHHVYLLDRKKPSNEEQYD